MLLLLTTDILAHALHDVQVPLHEPQPDSDTEDVTMAASTRKQHATCRPHVGIESHVRALNLAVSTAGHEVYEVVAAMPTKKHPVTTLMPRG